MNPAKSVCLTTAFCLFLVGCVGVKVETIDVLGEDYAVFKSYDNSSKSGELIGLSVRYERNQYECVSIEDCKRIVRELISGRPPSQINDPLDKPRPPAPTAETTSDLGPDTEDETRDSN